MIHLTRSLVRKWLESLLHIHDSPRRTAFAYALGVFWGFSPFFGLHTVLGLICAFLFNLNRVAVILGAYTNLPWIIAPVLHADDDGAPRRCSACGMPPDFSGQLSRLFELSIFGQRVLGRTGAAAVAAAVALRAGLAGRRLRPGGARPTSSRGPPSRRAGGTCTCTTTAPPPEDAP